MSFARRLRLAPPLSVALALVTLVLAPPACSSVLGLDGYTFDRTSVGSGGSATTSNSPLTGGDTTNSTSASGGGTTNSTSASGGGTTNSTSGGGGSAGCNDYPGLSLCGSYCTFLESDPSNCGSCGYVCAGGAPCYAGKCLAGSPTYLVAQLGRPDDVAVDTSTVYWTDQVAGEIGAVGKSGGVALTLATGLDQPYRMDLAGGRIYFTTVGDTQPGVWSMSVTGGTPLLLLGGDSFDSPYDVVVDGGTLFCSTYDKIRFLPAGGGGSATTLFGAGDLILRIALDADRVYWTEYNGGLVRSVSRSGGPVSTLASGLDHPEGVVVDGSYLYIAEVGVGNQCGQAGLGRILRLPKLGGAVVALATTDGCDPNEVAIDDGYVYWAEYTSGNVSRVPKGGGPVEFVAVNQVGPSELAVDQTSVYWGTHAVDPSWTGIVMVPK